MSSIKIRGYAYREVLADLAKYKISFVCKEAVVSRSIEIVKNQCERFLKYFKELGFDISQFHFSGDKVTERSYGSDDRTVYRTIEFETPFDARISNAIVTAVKREDLNVEIETEFVVSDIKKIRRELLKEAVMDSKEKVREIAEACGQSLKGIETISDDKYEVYDYDENERHLAGDVNGLLLDDESLFSELQPKLVKLEEVIFVSWILE